MFTKLKQWRRFTDKVPDHQEIIDSISKAHYLTPIKNGVYHYKIDVWGPSFQEEKHELAVSTVKGPNMFKYRESYNDKKAMEKLKSLYKVYLDNWPKRVDNVGFNLQVLAPYLLVYRRKDILKKSLDWTIQASMNAFILSTLLESKNIDVSFCRCFFHSDYLQNEIISNYNIPNQRYDEIKNQVLFMLSIGYADKQFGGNEKTNQPNIEEIVNII
jgi:hypothetical protein|tara:strand:- start:233 stop:877 length:645 start_codon:yes stop_codon:yes gene_type:complete